MENIWLLPDTGQSGTILAINREGKSVNIREVVPLRDIPHCFVLGIPEEVLRKQSGDDIVYGQFVRLKDRSSIFACSVVAGRDISGRRVFLTNLKKIRADEEIDYEGLKSFNLIKYRV